MTDKQSRTDAEQAPGDRNCQEEKGSARKEEIAGGERRRTAL